jgi:hypothetical protein
MKDRAGAGPDRVRDQSWKERKMTALDIEAFTQLADTHGSDIARWPEPRRAEAQALLARSAAARALLRDVARLDAALGGPTPDHALQPMRARILNAVARAPRPGRSPAKGRFWQTLWLELGGLRLVGPALAAALTLGVGLDQLVGSNSLSPPSETDLVSLALLDEDDEELLP